MGEVLQFPDNRPPPKIERVLTLPDLEYLVTKLPDVDAFHDGDHVLVPLPPVDKRGDLIYLIRLLHNRNCQWFEFRRSLAVGNSSKAYVWIFVGDVIMIRGQFIDEEKSNG